MYRQMQLCKRKHQRFQRVRQRNRRGGKGQKHAARHKKDRDPQNHEQGGPKSLCIDVKLPGFRRQERLSLGEEDIDDRGQRDNEDQRPERGQDQPERNAAECDQKNRRQRQRRKAERVFAQKDRHDIQNRRNDLRPGIGAVQGRVGGIVLPECNLFHSVTSRRAFRAEHHMRGRPCRCWRADQSPFSGAFRSVA